MKKPLSFIMALGMVAGLAIGCGRSDLSTPVAAAKTFYAAMEKEDVAGAQAAADGQPELIKALVDAYVGAKHMHDAGVAKFGDEANKNTIKGYVLPNLDGATAKENGDTAIVTAKGMSGGMYLRKVDGEWKMDTKVMFSQIKDTSLIARLATTADETADDIAAGKYKTWKAAQAGFDAKMMTFIK